MQGNLCTCRGEESFGGIRFVVRRGGGGGDDDDDAKQVDGSWETNLFLMCVSRRRRGVGLKATDADGGVLRPQIRTLQVG